MVPLCNLSENVFDIEVELLQAVVGIEARGPSPRICHATQYIQP